jgi:hypothetical protein
MNTTPISQVNIIAIGVENYQYMPKLRGPQKDILKLVEVIVQSPITGLYNLSQVKTIINPDSQTLRTHINDYIIGRSAEEDVLIIYFSGHGIPIGYSDFGLATIDARFHDVTGEILPLSVVRFSDLVYSLRIMNIIPVIIIDACYSGMIGSVMSIPAADAIKTVKEVVSMRNATNYALLCSCSDRQAAKDNINGGLFSQIFFDLLDKGLRNQRNKNIICLQDIFGDLKRRNLSEVTDSTPQLFLGETIPSIPLVRNRWYKLRGYRFHKYLAELIIFLWNKGNEIELDIREIMSNIGPGAYGNHRKLSYSGWALLEDNPQNGKRRLTERGKLFAQGKLLIPDEIVFDSITDDYIPPENPHLISIFDKVRD